MQVSVEKISNVLRRLTITVSVNHVEEVYTKHIQKFAKNANIKGFRRGKAPMSYITKHFGNDARADAVNEIIQETLYKAIADENLKPISMPRVEPKSMAPDQPLEFTASFEVLPEIEKVQVTLDKVEKLSVEVSPEDIERVIQQLMKQYTKWQVVDRAAQEKDSLVIDYYATFDGKSDIDNKIQDFALELGGKVMIPGFEQGLIGAKAGDEKVLNLTFPADFEVAERAGKPVEFNIKVKQVFGAELPVFNEDFIKQLGVKSGKEEDLKAQIQKTLSQERDRLVRENLKEQVFSKMLEQNPLEVPNSLVESEAKRIHDEVYGQKEHNHHQHSNEELTAFNEIAKKRVALSLLIAEYAKQTSLKPDKERVEQRIQEIASAYEKPDEVIAWLSSKEQRQGLEGQVLEDQVVEKLLEGVTTTEKAMSYAELKGIRL